MKFSSASNDIITICDDQWLAHECYIASLRSEEPILTGNRIEQQSRASLTLNGEDRDPRIGCDSRIKPVEETKTLELSLGKALKLGASLNCSNQDLVEETLKDNVDLFAWFAIDLPDVDPQVAVHKLSIFREARKEGW